MSAMDKTPQQEPERPGRAGRAGVPLWFRLFMLVLVGLVVAKMLGLEVFVEVSYDGIPFLASLTDARIYFVPLFLILIYILSLWMWKKFFGHDDNK